MSDKRTLPDFLLIGAQKSGTTTLYNDLAAQDAICVSTIKEPSVLLRIPEDDKAIEYYGRLFEVEPRHRRFGEGSTLYTQLPTHPAVAARARSLLGAELQLLYIVRNPVERAISHHYHAFSRGRAGPDVNAAVRSDAAFVDHGRYAMQLEPWLNEFARENLLVLRFEDYIKDRAAVLARVGDFLGVPVDAARIDTGKAYNKSEGNRVYGYLRPLMSKDIYRLWVRRAIPERLRRRVRDLVAPKAPPPPAPPRPDTIDYLIERLAPDAARLSALLGGGAPSWDFDATRRKYQAPAASAGS
jgi:hypothetical protein